MKNRLYHHGIKGQKWGVRRYRNFDGSLTTAGRKRYDVPAGGKKQQTSEERFGRKVSEASNAASNAARTTSTMLKRSSDNKKSRNKEDLSKMSDKELQQKINRMNMEKQYNRLKNEDIKTGRDYAADALALIGDLFTIGASAATIYATLHGAGVDINIPSYRRYVNL